MTACDRCGGRFSNPGRHAASDAHFAAVHAGVIAALRGRRRAALLEGHQVRDADGFLSGCHFLLPESRDRALCGRAPASAAERASVRAGSGACARSRADCADCCRIMGEG